jgi:hypothetical protein
LNRPGRRVTRSLVPGLWAALALAALAPLLVWATSCSTESSATARGTSPSPSVTLGPGGLPVVEPPHADWKHVDVVMSYLQAHAPERPVVYMLGGSAARESTISDRSWRQQIRDMGGPNVLAFNLGATNQSYDDNIAMVRVMPKVPSLVLIGINVGRYTRSPGRAHKLPAPSPSLTLDQVDDYPQHRFDDHHIMRDERKIAMIQSYWYAKRQPYFDENFDYDAKRLADLVALCRKRGLPVVMFNLPLNLQTLGHALDTQRERYRQDCLAVAKEYGVPYVDFLSDVPFVSRDFADNWHLVPTGRAKWQRALSQMTVTWLERYGVGHVAGSASTSP